MDWQRLILVLLQRLSPIYVATALWLLTDHFAMMIGGVAVSIILTVAWPFLQPLLAVLYEEVLHQRSHVQARRRTQFLNTVLPFLNAYKTVVAKYPPALLATSASPLSAQLAILADALRQVDRRCQLQADDPFTTPEQDTYALVQDRTFSVKDMRDWGHQACVTWAGNLCTALAHRGLPALRQAIQHFTAQHAGQTWQSCLAAAEHALDAEVDLALHQWSCLHKAQDNPEIRQRLAILLQLDAINRQANLKPYLTARPVACPPEEVRAVMAYMRYDSVASRMLALLEHPAQADAPAIVSAPVASP